MTKRINVKNILKVARAIGNAAKPDANPPIGFNMSGYWDRGADRTGHHCETVACVAGWAVFVQGGFRAIDDASKEWHGISFAATKFLGLGPEQEDALYMGRENYYVTNDIEPSQAVRTLRHLAKTGKVDWSMK